MSHDLGHHVSRVSLFAYKALAVKAMQATLSNVFDQSHVQEVLHPSSQNLAVQVALRQLYSSLRRKSGRRDEGLGVEEISELLLMHKVLQPHLEAQRDTQAGKALHLIGQNEGFVDASNDVPAVSRQAFVDFLSPRVHLLLNPMNARPKRRVPFYLGAVVATQAIVAFGSGTFLSTSMLYYSQVFQVKVELAAAYLGVGEFVAFLAMQLSRLADRQPLNSGMSPSSPATRTDCKRRESWSATILRTPLKVPVAVLFVGLLTAAFVVPSLPVAVVVQFLFSGLNDFSVSLLNELTAACLPVAEFRKHQATGQWLRRLGNCLTALTGPMLFRVRTWLPFVLHGSLVAVWAAVLWWSMYRHARELAPDAEKGTCPVVTAFRPFVRMPWHLYELPQNKAANTARRDPRSNLNDTLAHRRADVTSLKQPMQAFGTRSTDAACAVDAALTSHVDASTVASSSENVHQPLACP
jgi:hypothetical protein